jgi:hypothetical protein
MIHVSKESKQSAAQVLEKAVDYFGPDGLGLEIAHRDLTNVQLQGGGGHVVVRVQPQRDTGKTEVEIESREWEYEAEQFLGEI